MALLPSQPFLSVSLNQDASLLACGTATGLVVYSTSPFTRALTLSDGGRSIVECLFQTSLVATVGTGAHPTLSPRKLQMLNTADNSEICELNFVQTILKIRMSRKRLVAVLKNRIHIFDISSMKILRTVETEDNSRAVCCMSFGDENCLLAFPKTAGGGDVVIFDALHLNPISVVKAHKNAVGEMAFNVSGTMLATSSSKGTIIRVFAMPDGECIHSFRRGTYAATIYSLAFSSISDMLAVSSDTGTVHIYKIDPNSRAIRNSGDDDELSTPASAGGSSGHGNNASGSSNSSHQNLSGTGPSSVSASGSTGSFGAAAGGLMGGFLDMFSSERDFAHFKVASPAFHVVGFSPDDRKVFAASLDGTVVVHEVDCDKGGDCPCVQEYDLRSL